MKKLKFEVNLDYTFITNCTYKPKLFIGSNECILCEFFVDSEPIHTVLCNYNKTLLEKLDKLEELLDDC